MERKAIKGIDVRLGAELVERAYSERELESIRARVVERKVVS